MTILSQIIEEYTEHNNPPKISQANRTTMNLLEQAIQEYLKDHHPLRKDMTLLTQTIQEYLTDHHPKWLATQSNHNSVQFIEYKTKLSIYIILDTNNQTISAYTDYHIRHTDRITYTEHTFLPQITETIHTLEQQIHHP